MSAKLKWSQPVSAAALCGCLLVAHAAAQLPTQGEPDRPTYQPAQPGATTQPAVRPQTANQAQSSDVDRFLASCLMARSQAAIEISQLAEDRSDNGPVKQFAQQVTADHREMSRKLQSLAGMQSQQLGQTAAATGQFALPQQPPRPATDPSRPQDRAASAGAQDSAIDQLINIERQICDQATKYLRDELQDKPAAEFDECYLGSQVACHLEMKAALDVIQDQATGQLQQIAQTQQQTVEKHLRKAQQLLEQSTGPERQAERPVRPPVEGPLGLSR